MSNFTFDEAGSVAKLPKELGENVTSMLGGAEKAYHLISCWKRKVGGDPRLAALAQSIAADPELHRKRQMLYMRYLIGGRAELSAADVCSLDDMVTAQEGGAITLDQMRVVQGHLIDAMREMKFDKALIAGAIQHCEELQTARGNKAPPGLGPAGPKRKCSCCKLQ